MKTAPVLTFSTFAIFAGLCVIPQFVVLGAGETNWDAKRVKLIGSVVASIVLGLAALTIIFFKKEEADRKWAYGMVGTIAGYWLPSPL